MKISLFKKIGFLILICTFFGVFNYIYKRNINHNFETISEGKVFKSGAIPPIEIADYIKANKIKSVIDLRFPGTADLVNNPEIPSELLAEKEAVEKIKDVTYFNNGSDQVPNQKNLDFFFKIMDNKSNYPVLIHCYHGTGRAEMYAALYRIEYENFTNEEARSKVRTILKWSSFDKGKPKGDFLINYKSRNSK